VKNQKDERGHRKCQREEEKVQDKGVKKEKRSLDKEIEGRKGEASGVEGSRERPNGVGKYKNIKESVGRKFLYISVSGTQ
jgi:hypothetical protein